MWTLAGTVLFITGWWVWFCWLLERLTEPYRAEREAQLQ